MFVSRFMLTKQKISRMVENTSYSVDRPLGCFHHLRGL